MSLSPNNEIDSNEGTSNLANSEEPKISQEQRSLMDPSTERGSKYFLIFILSVDEEDSGDINGDDNIFEADDYYNYNELLSPYFNRQFAQLSYEGITDGINSVINYEK